MNKLLLSLMVFFTTASFAATKPEVCPATEVIKKADFSFIGYSSDGDMYVAGISNKFNTPNMWGFIMVIPNDQAVNLMDALTKATAALQSLSGMPRPMPAPRHTWRCKYYTSSDFPAIAFTSGGDGLESVSNIKSYSSLLLR